MYVCVYVCVCLSEMKGCNIKPSDKKHCTKKTSERKRVTAAGCTYLTCSIEKRREVDKVRCEKTKIYHRSCWVIAWKQNLFVSDCLLY